MRILDWVTGRYAGHPEAVVITTFFNPMNSPYRIAAFEKWYETVRHLNHRVIECVIGDAKPQLPETDSIERIHTENLLWHKEALLNRIIAKLPKQFKYIFWVDADVLFTNRLWLVQAVEKLQRASILQPFEFCVHLNKGELAPDFNLDGFRSMSGNPRLRHPRMWRSFCANVADGSAYARSENYDVHGHVGFAWGGRRELLEAVPLYDRALIGGADHIIAHAAAGQIPHSCITKSFKDDLPAVEEWSRRFADRSRRKIGFVQGDLFHLWHGDIDRRQYLKRIQDFTNQTRLINERDKHGLYVTRKPDSKYITSYFQHREVAPISVPHDEGFLISMALGYMTDSGLLGGALGGNFLGGIVGQELRDLGEAHHGEAPPVDTGSNPASDSIQSHHILPDSVSQTFS